MGQAEAASKMPRYDPYLRRACAERALNLCDRNFGYRIVPSGGIVDRELDAAECLIFVSEPFAEPEEFSGLFSGCLEVETNKRNFEFNISLDEQLPGHAISSSHATNRAPATSATSAAGNCCNPTNALC